MITDADVTKLKEVFATKTELGEIKLEMGEVHDTIDTMAAAIGRIENSIDGLVGSIHTQQTENGAGAVHLARHDRQIEALALATHTELPD